MQIKSSELQNQNLNENGAPNMEEASGKIATSTVKTRSGTKVHL